MKKVFLFMLTVMLALTTNSHVVIKFYDKKIVRSGSIYSGNIILLIRVANLQSGNPESHPNYFSEGAKKICNPVQRNETFRSQCLEKCFKKKIIQFFNCLK